MTLPCLHPVHDLTSSSLHIVLKPTLSPRQAHLLELSCADSWSLAVLQAILKHTALKLRGTPCTGPRFKLYESGVREEAAAPTSAGSPRVFTYPAKSFKSTVNFCLKNCMTLSSIYLLQVFLFPLSYTSYLSASLSIGLQDQKGRWQLFCLTSCTEQATVSSPLLSLLFLAELRNIIK